MNSTWIIYTYFKKKQDKCICSVSDLDPEPDPDPPEFSGSGWIRIAPKQAKTVGKRVYVNLKYFYNETHE